MTATFDELILAREGLRIPQGALNGLVATSDATGNVVWETVDAAVGSGGPLRKNNNLDDVQDVPTSRANLGLGSAATHAASDFATAGSGATRQYTMLEASGDSYGSGVGSFDNQHGFNNILAAMLGIPLNNHSIGGAAAAWPNLDQNGGGDGGYANVLQTQVPPNSVGPYLPQASLVSLVWGFNDLWNNGKTAAIGPFISAMRLICSRYRAGGVFAVNTTPWSAASNLGLVASGLNGDGQLWANSTASPASYTFTVPADVPANTVISIYGGVSPSSVGTLTFTKNGAASGAGLNLATISNNSAIANVYCGWCYRITASPGDVVVITATYTAGGVTINGAMPEAANAPVIIMQNCPHVPATAATYGWASQAAMWADIDSLNTAQANLAAEFADGRVKNYDVVTALGSAAYGTAGSNYVSDNLHPTPEGHAILAQQALAAANSVALTTAQISEMAKYPPEKTKGPKSQYVVGLSAGLYPYTMQLKDRVVQCTGTGARGITLPDAMLATQGAEYVIMDTAGNAAANAITLSCWGSQTINGATTYTINTNYGNVVLVSDGVKWIVRSSR